MVSRELRTARTVDYAHCTAGLDLTHYPEALSRSTARGSDSERGRVDEKWSLDLIPRSASDPNPRSRVESPCVIISDTDIVNLKSLHSLFDTTLFAYII